MLEMTGLLEAIQLPAIAAISLFLLHAGIVCVVSWRRIESATAAALTRRLGVLLVVFAPLSTGIYAVLYTIPSSYRPPVSLDFVVALAWSFVLISAFVRYLNKLEMPLEHGVSPSFRAEYGITPREAEVISLVAEGLSNQQIADRLNVSFTTVRTHVYNVFRKTGSSSRMELVRLASSYPE
jgi:DNA-binding CsgD family transcriptional regulator